MKKIKLIIGWISILLLIVFVAINMQATQVELFYSTALRAPLGLLLILAAVLGAMGSQVFRTLWAWAKGRDR